MCLRIEAKQDVFPARTCSLVIGAWLLNLGLFAGRSRLRIRGDYRLNGPCRLVRSTRLECAESARCHADAGPRVFGAFGQIAYDRFSMKRNLRCTFEAKQDNLWIQSSISCGIFCIGEMKSERQVPLCAMRGPGKVDFFPRSVDFTGVRGDSTQAVSLRVR
jgi:hypothetical protein